MGRPQVLEGSRYIVGLRCGYMAVADQWLARPGTIIPGVEQKLQSKRRGPSRPKYPRNARFVQHSASVSAKTTDSGGRDPIDAFASYISSAASFPRRLPRRF